MLTRTILFFSLEQGSFTEYTIESTSLSLPGDEWEECVDAEGRTFFYNDRTGESTWDDPRNNPSLMLMSGGGDGRDDDGGAMVLSSAGEWEEVVDADGAIYYYNSETGVTSWDRPDGLEGGGGSDGVGGMALGASWAGEEVVTDDGQKWEQADDGEGNFYWCVCELTHTQISTAPPPRPPGLHLATTPRPRRTTTTHALHPIPRYNSETGVSSWDFPT